MEGRQQTQCHSALMGLRSSLAHLHQVQWNYKRGEFGSLCLWEISKRPLSLFGRSCHFLGAGIITFGLVIRKWCLFCICYLLEFGIPSIFLDCKARWDLYDHLARSLRIAGNRILPAFLFQLLGWFFFVNTGRERGVYFCGPGKVIFP